MKTNNQPTNKYKLAFWSVMIIALCFFISLGFDYLIKEEYNSGRTQGQLDIINETTQTGTIFYLMNTSDAKSINSTSISKIQQDFLTSCIKAGVCTFNQTKYNELMRGQ
jgi:hypothetical protein